VAVKAGCGCYRRMIHAGRFPVGLAAAMTGVAGDGSRHVIGVFGQDARAANHEVAVVAGGASQVRDHGVVHGGRLEGDEVLVATITLHNPGRHVSTVLHFTAADTRVAGSTPACRIGRMSINGPGPNGGVQVAGIAGRAGGQVVYRFTDPSTGRCQMCTIVTGGAGGGQCNRVVHRCRLP